MLNTTRSKGSCHPSLADFRTGWAALVCTKKELSHARDAKFNQVDYRFLASCTARGVLIPPCQPGCHQSPTQDGTKMPTTPSSSLCRLRVLSVPSPCRIVRQFSCKGMFLFFSFFFSFSYFAFFVQASPAALHHVPMRRAFFKATTTLTPTAHSKQR